MSIYVHDCSPAVSQPAQIAEERPLGMHAAVGAPQAHGAPLAIANHNRKGYDSTACTGHIRASWEWHVLLAAGHVIELQLVCLQLQTAIAACMSGC